MHIEVKLKKASDRNTESHWVSVAGVDMFFSYATCMAFIGGRRCMCRKNTFGPTTGRQMNEAGVRAFSQAKSEEEFDAALQRVLQDAIHPALHTLQELTK